MGVIVSPRAPVPTPRRRGVRLPEAEVFGDEDLQRRDRVVHAFHVLTNVSYPSALMSPPSRRGNDWWLPRAGGR